MPSTHHFHLPRLHPRTRRDVNMTEGNITRHIITFAIPLLIGNLFQQLYNTVDTWVVGNYVSNAAFSAVGSVAPIINTLIGFFMGLSSGAGVVISQYYGANRHDEVKKAVHTTIALTLGLAVIFTFLGLFLIPYMLELMKTPESVRPESTAYLTIYFSGIFGLMLYNAGAGILRAVGDSQRPFYFLVVCALVNTGLDLLFVLVFGMGVEGVALATVIAQFVSAVMVIITLIRSTNCVQLHPKEIRFHANALKKIFRIGIPAALQLSVTAFSNVFVQSYINAFGEDYMASWTAYSKIDQLLFLPMQSIALAATTFVGQNLGSRQAKRAKRGVVHSIVISLIATSVLMIPILIFAGPVVSFFNSKAEVVSIGSMLLRWLTPFYLLCCFNQIYAGALRGAGNSKASMIFMLSSFVAFRQIYLFVASRLTDNFLILAMAYPAGWLVCSLATTIYFYRFNMEKTRLVDDK